jgi:tetratricopeptide (TPR) repeat protein
MRRDLLVSLFLVVASFVVYGSVARHDFVNFDDDDYVYENPEVRRGLTQEGFLWAFRSIRENNWHPLTWLSHMVDVHLFGLNAGAHHVVNLLLHILNSLLLYRVLRGMTGAVWRSGMVAALFALHPLHVESVAWVSERKDVLSTLFFMLTLWAYGRYATRPSWFRYVPVFLLLGLGLMAKPMLVTLPFVLLLLDFWPLERFHPWKRMTAAATESVPDEGKGRQGTTGLRLILEKLPLFGLVAASSAVTFVAQKEGGAMRLTDVVPVGDRISNALVSYVVYIGKMLWPTRLAVFYPYNEALPWTLWMSAAIALVGISVMVVWASRRWRYLFVGWFWYLGILVPVIGLVQVGSQSMADRYTYVPLIGLFVMAVWGAADIAAGSRRGRTILSASAGILLLSCMVGTWFQVGHWRNSRTLFEHALKVTEDNEVAHNNLGNALEREGSLDEAIAHYQEALRIDPEFAPAHNNLGIVFARKGDPDRAVAHLRAVLRTHPGFAPGYNNLGKVLADQGKWEEAIALYREALRIHPQFVEAHNNLGIALDEQGNGEQAIAHYQTALRIKPDHAEAHNNLGMALADQGKDDEAIAHYEQALRLKPDLADAHYNLGIMMTRQDKTEEAIAHYQQTLRIDPKYAEAHYNLGILLDRQDRLDEATKHYGEAVRIHPDYAEAHNNLGIAWVRQGKPDQAIAHFRAALRVHPEDGRIQGNLQILLKAREHYNRGAVLARQGETDEAMAHFRAALRLNAAYPEARIGLALLLSQRGRFDEAVVSYQEALRLKPDDLNACNNLAWIRATHPDPKLRDGAEAVELAERASELRNEKDPNLLDTLADAYAEAGRFDEAVATTQEAISLATSRGPKELVAQLEKRLESYKRGRPYREHLPSPQVGEP